MSNKIAVFISINNQFYYVNKKWPNRKLDYKKYYDRVNEIGHVTRAFAYGVQFEESAINFITALNHIGYETNYREIAKYFTWDVGICIDMIRMIGKCDTMVLGYSGSGNALVPLVEYLKVNGVKVIIMACCINRELKDVADQWIEIDETLLEKINITTE
jgi:uncharacterized LabA/DUF88 family protein